MISAIRGAKTMMSFHRTVPLDRKALDKARADDRASPAASIALWLVLGTLCWVGIFSLFA